MTEHNPNLVPWLRAAQERGGKGAVELDARSIGRVADWIEALEGALRWEAGEVCENPEGECVVDYPDGPDLWCRYCRIMSVLAGERDD